MGTSIGGKAGHGSTAIFQEISRHRRSLGDPSADWRKQLPVLGVLRRIESVDPDRWFFEETTENPTAGNRVG